MYLDLQWDGPSRGILTEVRGGGCGPGGRGRASCLCPQLWWSGQAPSARWQAESSHSELSQICVFIMTVFQPVAVRRV